MDLFGIIINFSWQLRTDFLVPGGTATAVVFPLNEWTVVQGTQTHMVMSETQDNFSAGGEGRGRPGTKGLLGVWFLSARAGDKACWWCRKVGGVEPFW